MEKKLVKSDCTLSYHYYKGSNDGIAIVLVHGYGVNHTMWQPQVGFLKGRYTVINLDVRGHGSSRPCSSFSVKKAAEDLKDILAAEKCEKYIIAGLSMGGYIAQEYAFLYGGALGYMIVGATPIFLPCFSGREKFALKHSAGVFRLYSWNTLKKLMTKACATTAEARKMVFSMFDSMDKEAFISSWKGITESLHEENMQFDAPLLVACGDRDKTGTIKKCMPYWQPAYQHCTVRMIPHAAHVANLDAPEFFNRMMDEFIQACIKKQI